MSDGQPLPFPHDARQAAKTERAGVVTVNDLICQDQFGIATRETEGEAASLVSAVYAYTGDTGSLAEASRATHTMAADGSACASLAVARTDGANRSMDEVLRCAPGGTNISAHDQAGSVTASFTRQGLRWDDATSAVYIGGNEFRIMFSEGDEESGGVPALRIQARDRVRGGYVSKLVINND